LAERYITKDVPSTNWGYQTAPQESLNGRVLDLSRGKALGGSSAINYACWTIGPKDDYDYWAELVGDDSFRWEHAQRRYKAIETYEVDLPSQFQPVVKPKGEDHGLSGPLHVQYSGRLDPKVTTAVELAESIGFKRLDDVNTGEVRGVGVYVIMINASMATAEIPIEFPRLHMTESVKRPLPLSSKILRRTSASLLIPS